MSSLTYEFCAGAPTWPGCDQVIADHNAAQSAPKDSGKMMDGDDHMMEEKADPMMGQFVYTLTAVLSAANAGLTLTRYEDRYDTEVLDSVFDGQNWIAVYRQIVDYSGLAFWSVASLTQIATLFGAMAEINLMVWMYGSMVMGLLGLVVEAVMWLARDEASQSDSGFAVTTYNIVETDMVKYAAMSTAVTLNLAMEHENWMAAQWMLLDDETKDKWMGDDDEEPESLFSLMF